MTIPALLVIFPFVAAAGLWCARSDLLRRLVVGVAVLVVCAATGFLPFISAFKSLIDFSVNPHWIEWLVFVLEIGIAAYVIYVGVRAKIRRLFL